MLTIVERTIPRKARNKYFNYYQTEGDSSLNINASDTNQ